MRSALLLCTALAGFAAAGTARADTLREALARTYEANPTINASRAQVRTLDEGVALARAQNRLQVAGTGGLNQDLTRTGGGTGRNLSLGFDISYPLFNGGRNRNQIRAADTRVEAGRANLRATEGDVFTEATGAYMDVIRDRSIVSLNENQVRVLQTNLEATRDRFEVGDLTVDVPQHTVTRGDEEIQLTPLEFDLLVEMARKPNQVHSREELLESVWGYRNASDTRLVNVHVQRLRSKIEHDPENPEIILTVRGVGYRLAP